MMALCRGCAVPALAPPPLFRRTAPGGSMEKPPAEQPSNYHHYRFRLEKKIRMLDVAVKSGRGFGGSSAGAATKKGAAELEWRCSSGCGACCNLDKGPAFPSPEEIFQDDPPLLELYKSLVGPDGWCIHYDRDTRTCSIYADRPSFCRVSPQVFQTLFGIDERSFHKEACKSCRDTIKAVYGSKSDELKNFNRVLREDR